MNDIASIILCKFVNKYYENANHHQMNSNQTQNSSNNEHPEFNQSLFNRKLQIAINCDNLCVNDYSENQNFKFPILRNTTSQQAPKVGRL